MRTSTLALTTPETSIGDTVDGRYHLLREIARGGAGTVYEARHLHTGRAVAVKLLHRQFLRSPEAQERLLREARALTMVRHPAIVEVLDAGSTDAGAYLVLEMLEGRTLDGILAVRRLSVAEAVRVARQICDALAFAHARGVVHRDIKPSNVFLSRNALGHEVVKLIDFGIATVPTDDSVSSRKLTRAGELIGTPEYMAPEQLLAKPDLDARCDVYSTAVTIFECLAGRAPFVGNYPEVMMQVMSAEAPPSIATMMNGVSPRLDRALAAALAKEPADRTATPLAFAKMLEEAAGVTAGDTTLLGEFPARPGVRVPTPMAMIRPPSAPPAAEQRRRFVRAPYVTPVRVLDVNGVSMDGRSEDVSEGGLLILTSRACQEQRVRVRFALPITGQIVDVAATARWVREARGRHAIGLEFVAASLEVKETIDRYVRLMKAG